MAIFFPSNQFRPVYFTALGMASDMRHLEKPSGRIISACSWRSSYSFLPTMPRSVTPVATHWGMSSSRRYRTSMGKSALCTSSVRLLVLTLIPASASSDMVSSKSLPLD